MSPQPILKKKTAIEIRDFIRWWNSNFPLDVWYRDHFGIRFNSKEHRNLNLIDMRIELEEMLFSIELQEKRKDLKERTRQYQNEGLWLNATSYSEEEIDEAFDNLDIKALQEQQLKAKENA